MQEIVQPVTTHSMAFAPVASRFARYLLTLTVPAAAATFSLTGPHSWQASSAFIALVVAHVLADRFAPVSREAPIEGEPAWLYDGLLNLLGILQLVNVVLVCRMIGMVELTTAAGALDLIAATVLVGTSSGLSGIVVAHELMHRPQAGKQLLSRFIMGSVFYEHFFTEHIRGHHVNIGKHEDGATARYGETFKEFWLRTVPAQFRSAWNIEVKRNGLEGVPVLHARQLHNRVVQGILGELAFAASMGALFGIGGVVMFFAQAYWSVRLLEAVNYFEHWGLQRQGRKVQPVDSWDTESSFTRFGLVGLSRHADHHAYASRPYQKLRHFEQSAKYPGGYLSMVCTVVMRNERFQEIATAELKARKLGPFAEAQAA